MSDLSPEPTSGDSPTDFFHRRESTRVPLSGESIAEGPGDVIGSYKLLQQIGEGGMGVVFMAEQTSPVHRTVALKIIKPGMDSRQVIARFEAERQALALMDHPNIACVLDAGATASGRPYFVMELVKGVAITEYCDEHHLTPRERLELFLPVCQAVQHAHQKGVIHRDIKPSNVMVAEYDQRAIPKIIDFGVAKATAQRLTERTMFTEFGQVLGTVEYMSPEQAKLNQLDIDTRTDVYSLGVLLYELLTGQTPFDRQRLHSAAFDEMLRIIREEEPPKPSTRLSSNDALASIAANRRLEPLKLAKLVRGELDWIVMKALEKDRNRRYETANGLARDLERYLADEPVQACPPSAAYRFHKLARRNKAALVTAAIVAASLLLGTGISIWQATLARRAESLAETRLVAEQAARRQATAEAAKATAINNLLRQMLQSANPDAARGADYTVRRMLDDFAARFGDQLHDQPEAEATIHATIGNAYQRMGALDKAEPHVEAALRLRQKVFGEDHVEVANSLVDLARLKSEQGKTTAAISLANDALAIHRRLKLPEEQTIKVLDELALHLWAVGHWDELNPVIDEIRAIAAKNPDKYPEVANLLHRLAETMQDPVVGERYARESVALHRRLHGETHPETGWGLQALALTLRRQGKLADAERSYREALEVFRKNYAEFDAPVVLTMKNLAIVLRSSGDEAGLDELRQWAETLAAADGPDHEAWLYGGEFFAELGQWERAERFIAKSMLSPGASDRKAKNLARIQLARQREAKKVLAESDDARSKSK